MTTTASKVSPAAVTSIDLDDHLAESAALAHMTQRVR
jgi:hypothetical protein